MSEHTFDANVIQKKFEEYSEGRLKRYDRGLDGTARWQQKSAAALEVLMTENHRLKLHAGNLQRFMGQHEEAVKAIHEGQLSLPSAEERLRPLWLKISSAEARHVVLDAYDRVGHPRTGFEADWIAAAFDNTEISDYQREGVFGRFGAQSLKPRRRRNEPTGEVGRRQDPLPGDPQDQLRGSRTLALGGIQLHGAPGSARIFTGVHENTAAVGIIGSSGASAFSGVNVKSICVHLR